MKVGNVLMSSRTLIAYVGVPVRHWYETLENLFIFEIFTKVFL